jgi:hypothetical protein
MDYKHGHEIYPFYRSTHERVLELVDDLTVEQVARQPADSTLSIGFHLWHLARWADELQAAIAGYIPELNSREQIWEQEGLAERWGLEASQLGEKQTGQLLTEDEATQLPLPEKNTLREYAQRSFEAADRVVEVLDELFENVGSADDEAKKILLAMRRASMDFLTHDNRHLGMMECLKGILTGEGTATI